jgi:hypothetical protein
MGHRRHARDLLRRPPPTPHIVVVLSALVPPSLLLYFFCRHLGNSRRGERGSDRGGRKRLTGRRRRSYSREPPPSTYVHETEILLSGQTSTIRAGQAGSPPVRRPDVLGEAAKRRSPLLVGSWLWPELAYYAIHHGARELAWSLSEGADHKPSGQAETSHTGCGRQLNVLQRLPGSATRSISRLAYRPCRAGETTPSRALGCTRTAETEASVWEQLVASGDSMISTFRHASVLICTIADCRFRFDSEFRRCSSLKFNSECPMLTSLPWALILNFSILNFEDAVAWILILNVRCSLHCLGNLFKTFHILFYINSPQSTIFTQSEKIKYYLVPALLG